MSATHWRDFYTLESYIAKEERQHVSTRGVFSNLIRRIGLASKVISAKVQKAGLLNVLGEHGVENIQGEQQQKLDVLANEAMKATFSWMPRVAGIATEEEEHFVAFDPQGKNVGERYVILFDPLDGSSNIDANVSVGTIFSIRRLDNGDRTCQLEDFLRPGREQVAAGYVIYGSSTMFVYTAGHGVHGFTLDPEVGEYVLSHENIRLPEVCKCFSANETYFPRWNEPTQQFVDQLRHSDDPRYAKTTSRYIGSMVADIHRNLLYGGVFLYPADAETGKGKLRLLYECAPMAFLVEQAGGLATTGHERIMDILPTQLHQRVPIVIGNRYEVERYEELVREHDLAHKTG